MITIGNYTVREVDEKSHACLGEIYILHACFVVIFLGLLITDRMTDRQVHLS